MDKYEALEEFGLENREAKIYVKLLEIGGGGASEIAKKVNILRPTVYDILDNMIKKGVVSYSISAGRKVFSAVDPQILQQIVDEKKRIISQFVPELNEISKGSLVKPFVETYLGPKGVKTIYDDMLKEGKDVYHIFNYREYSKTFKLFFIQNFIKRRVERGINFRGIVSHIEDPEIAKSDKKSLRELRTLDSLSEFEATLFIYGDKCGFMTYTETPMGILIKNKIIASSFMILFNYLWKQAKST